MRGLLWTVGLLWRIRASLHVLAKHGMAKHRFAEEGGVGTAHLAFSDCYQLGFLRLRPLSRSFLQGPCMQFHSDCLLFVYESSGNSKVTVGYVPCVMSKTLRLTTHVPRTTSTQTTHAHPPRTKIQAC